MRRGCLRGEEEERERYMFVHSASAFRSRTQVCCSFPLWSVVSEVHPRQAIHPSRGFRLFTSGASIDQLRLSVPVSHPHPSTL